MELPRQVFIREVGPREGFQFEKKVYPTTDKVELIKALAQTGLREIEVTSFVRADRVPQMADAEELVAQLPVYPGVKYSAVYLNLKGFERALATGKLDLRIYASVPASEPFAQRNLNRSIDGAFQDVEDRMQKFRALGCETVELGVSAAFGCNYQGDVPLEAVLNTLDRLYRLATDYGLRIDCIRLADTMGWANPRQMIITIDAVRERWPDIPLGLHLHDTRGLGLATAYAALTRGVTMFDASIAGLGGCPFAGHKGAAGNIATEDFVFLCHELGIETGIDLDRLIECAKLAERIIGRPLPSKVKDGGNLAVYRNRRAS